VLLKKESSYNVSKIGLKEGINDKENPYSGANHKDDVVTKSTSSMGMIPIISML